MLKKYFCAGLYEANGSNLADFVYLSEDAKFNQLTSG